jgi:peptidoglycan/LPS O-acetylase OafA/YrhL
MREGRFAMKPGIFRLILACVVLVHHNFPLRMGAFAVGLFFVLSGYWISRMWRSKYSLRRWAYVDFAISRWWRLVPVFVTVNGLAAVLAMTGQLSGNTSPVGNPGWWMTQLSVLGATTFGRLLPPVWSLDVEMQFYLIAPLTIAVIAMASRSIVASVIAVTLGWSLLRFATGTEMEMARLDLYLWPFLIGIAADRWSWEPSQRLVGASVATLMGLVVLLIANPSTRHLIWVRGSDVGSGAPDVLAAALLYVGSVLLGVPLALHTVSRQSGSVDRWFGDLSYPLYLFHWIPREWYYANADWTEPAWRNGLLLMANFMLSLAGAIALLHLIDRPSQRIRTRWLRGRSQRLPTADQPIAAS